jgi:alkanesulfonate monooxygenase SsuD/methylene tetrahydromethanopterin reductase-like flavin-dependent oxidoreductase (luciferase family)
LQGKLKHLMTTDQPLHNTSSKPRRGFGVVGSLPPNVIRALAAAAETAGYATFWVNDGPQGEGLAALAEAASVTNAIQLAVGAIPLDRVSPEQMAARVAELDLPVERLIVGVGSGGPSGGLGRVKRGIAILRAATAATLVVAAMGPKMCRLAGEIADGVLLDWATPAYAREVQGMAVEGAAAANRPRPWIASYVFTALGAAASGKLRAEAEYYAAIPSYAAHFARMNSGSLLTTTFAPDAASLQRELSRFDAALDEPVVRAVVFEETIEAYLALLQAAAPIRFSPSVRL